jgi:hypothetical protein
MASVIEKLKLKKTPSKKTTFQVAIPAVVKPKMSEDGGIAKIDDVRPSIEESKGDDAQEKELRKHGVKVEDKTKAGLVNRDEIMKRIKMKRAEGSKDVVAQPKPKMKIKVKKPKLTKVDDDGNVVVVPKDMSSKPTIKIRRRAPKIRTTKAIDKSMIVPYTKSMKFGDELLVDIIPKPFKYSLKPSPYFLNNRKRFTNFIQSRFAGYIEDLKVESAGATCKKDPSGKDKPFTPFSHQKIVRDYLNLVSPYRGLLVYHGLGSGKTCTSITIAEGMKQERPILVMTPASLQANYRSELLKCGDPIFRKNQYWTKVDLTGATDEEILGYAELLHVKDTYLRKKKHAWFANKKQTTSNYNTLTDLDRQSLDEQITHLVEQKYQFINYNGLQKGTYAKLTENNTVNIFSNKVVIIDEAHNLVSRIVNKLNRKKSIAYMLYEQLMRAENCKIVLLTGTPIINYPNEIGILFNILRGYIYTFTIPLSINTTRRVNEDLVKKSLSKLNLLDYIEYRPSTKNLVITRNPFGFISTYNEEGKYQGVELDERGQVTNANLIQMILLQLQKDGIIDDARALQKLVKLSEPPLKALPDDRDEFISLFINTSNGEFMDENKFKKRILGLTSYFKSAQEKLMPEIKGEYIEKIPMSEYQFGVYSKIRSVEREREKKSDKKKTKVVDGEVFDDTPSTYKIFSRAACNFVFPEEVPRPKPRESEDVEGGEADGEPEMKSQRDAIDEEDIDGVEAHERINKTDGRYDADDDEALIASVERKEIKSYATRIKETIDEMKLRGSTFLDTESDTGLKRLSPKFLKLYENINDERNEGLHMVYSQFRTLEGIGLFKLVLEQNGYAEFKLKRKVVDGKEDFVVDISEEDMIKPKFALYTGTETTEEKEMVRKIYNNDFSNLNRELLGQIKSMGTNNIYGDIIKVFMITASGAEGINLKNTRYVHIVEPYWHPVRVEQVIGRARRICSHEEIEDPEKRTVEVYHYLMEIEEAMASSDSQLQMRDVSKRDKVTVFSTDQTLNEISDIKRELNKQILTNVKESSLDCNIYQSINPSEGLKCFNFGEVSEDSFASKPAYSEEEGDATSELNQKKTAMKFTKITMDGKSYAFVKDTLSVYDLQSVVNYKKDPSKYPAPSYLGKLVKKDGKFGIKKD